MLSPILRRLSWSSRSLFPKKLTRSLVSHWVVNPPQMNRCGSPHLKALSQHVVHISFWLVRQGKHCLGVQTLIKIILCGKESRIYMFHTKWDFWFGRLFIMLFLRFVTCGEGLLFVLPYAQDVRLMVKTQCMPCGVKKFSMESTSLMKWWGDISGSNFLPLLIYGRFFWGCGIELVLISWP